MTLISTPYPNNSRVISGNAAIFNDDVVLLCDTSVLPTSITLQQIPAGFFNTQYRLYVKDNSNNAGTNNITINAPSGYKINNSSKFVINQNNGGVMLVITSDTDYTCLSVLGTKIFADATARGLSVPDYIGQPGVTLTDTSTIYIGNALTAGAWTAATGGGSVTYTNLTPTSVAIGGIPAGSTFNAQTMQQMWDMLLYPYQYPSFSSFSISGQTSPLEAGDSVIGGSQTFIWSTSNPTNVQANSITIADVTGAVTLGTGLANDGSEVLNIGSSKTVAGQGSYIWSITGTNSNAGAFSTTYTVTWYFRKFYGISANSVLTASQIQALTSSSLSSTKNGTYSFGANDYKYFAWPDSFGSPAASTGFKDSSTGLAVDMATSSDDAAYSNTENGWSYALISVTNGFGVTTNYRLYRTRNTLGGTIDIIVS